MARFALAPSPRLALLIVVLHASAAACAFAALPTMTGGLLAAALLALGLAAAWSRALLRSRSSVRALEVGAAGLLVELTDGERLAAEAGERRYVSRLAVALPLRHPARRTVLVTADMLPAADFRRLRLWALWGRLPGVATAQLAA